MSEECRLIQGKLPAYNKRELPPDERDKVTGHLGACSACGQELALLMSAATAPARQELAGPAAPKSRREGPNPALVGIVVALIVTVVGFRVVQSRRAPVAVPASSPVSSPIPSSVLTPKTEPFPPIPAVLPKTEESKAPAVRRQLHLRLYAEDPMAANDRFLHLLAEIPTQMVEPPVPIRYDLLLQPEVAEIFLQRLKEIGPAEVQQDSAGDPEAPVHLIVEILPRG